MFWLTLIACVTTDEQPTQATDVVNEDPITSSEGSEPATEADPSPPEPSVPDPVDLSDGYAFVPASYAQREPPVIMLVAGDSISDAYGASAASLSYDELLLNNDDQTYPEFAGQDLSTWFPSLQGSLDVSFPGAQTDTLVSYQLPAMQQALDNNFPNGLTGPAMAFVTIGGNDLQEAIYPWANEDEVIAASLDNMQTIMDWFTDEDRFPYGVEVYMTNVYDPSDDVGRSVCFFFLDYSDKLYKLEEFNREVHDMGQREQVATVDLWRNFWGHGFNFADEDTPHYRPDDPTKWFANDCIHPNDRGHHELRRLFLGAVAGELGPLTP